MSVFSQYRFYSTELDAPAVRLSISDARGAEYFAIVEAGIGKGWRDRRNDALETIERAMIAGQPAGLVTVIPSI